MSRGDKDVGESRNNAESEPAVKFNESREVETRVGKGEYFPLHRHQDSFRINQKYERKHIES